MHKNNKLKKILIISQYFPPDISGGGTRAFNYAKCLSKNYDVTVITAFPHLHSKVPSKYKFHLKKTENIEDMKIIRVRVPSLLHNSIKNRIILHISFLISSETLIIITFAKYKDKPFRLKAKIINPGIK